MWCCRSFDTSKGEWQTIQLPLIEFTPVFRAKTVKNSPPIDVSALNSIQLMLSKFEYDGQLNPSFKAGPFSLPVKSWSWAAAFQLSLFVERNWFCARLKS
jgi:hypothetical protein